MRSAARTRFRRPPATGALATPPTGALGDSSQDWCEYRVGDVGQQHADQIGLGPDAGSPPADWAGIPVMPPPP